MKQILFYFALIHLLASCNKAPDTPEEILARFDQNKKSFEKLDSAIRNNQQAMQLFDELHAERKSTEFPGTIAEQSKSLGISAVAKHYNVIGKNIKPLIVFNASWNPEYPIIILQNPYDSIQTKRSYYRKDINNNEFIGAGDEWMVYKEINHPRSKQ